MVSRSWAELAEDDSWKPEVVAYSWGEGQVNGHGRYIDGGYIGTPRLLPCSQTEVIRQVVCSHETTFVVSARGGVLWWGASWAKDVIPSTDTPRELGFDGHRIASVAVSVPGYHHRQAKGTYHGAAITEAGALYTWGFNMFGQLMLHPKQTAAQRPNQVPHPTRVTCFPPEERFAGVACGITMTVVHTKTGCGASKVRSAGLYNFSTQYRDDHTSCEDVDLKGGAVSHVVCGGFSACAVLVSGEIWTWGDVKGPDSADGSLLGRPNVEYSPFWDSSGDR